MPSLYYVTAVHSFGMVDFGPRALTNILYCGEELGNGAQCAESFNTRIALLFKSLSLGHLHIAELLE